MGKFYCGAQKKIVNVHVELFVTLQDQPERRGANYIMLGNGRYTSRFGYAIDLIQIQEKNPACDNCLHDIYMKEETPSLSTMNKCLNCGSWNVDVSNELEEKRS